MKVSRQPASHRHNFLFSTCLHVYVRRRFQFVCLCLFSPPSFEATRIVKKHLRSFAAPKRTKEFSIFDLQFTNIGPVYNQVPLFPKMNLNRWSKSAIKRAPTASIVSTFYLSLRICFG